MIYFVVHDDATVSHIDEADVTKTETVNAWDDGLISIFRVDEQLEEVTFYDGTEPQWVVIKQQTREDSNGN